jgi:hypothetical protein
LHHNRGLRIYDRRITVWVIIGGIGISITVGRTNAKPNSNAYAAVVRVRISSVISVIAAIVPGAAGGVYMAAAVIS